MASSTSLSSHFSLLLLLAALSLASALNMSIIDYDKQHNQMGGPPRLRSHDEVLSIYESWLAHHGKAYNALGEKERRFEIFKDNLRFVDEHNSVDRPYKVGLNRFADLTNEEYRSKFMGAKRSEIKARRVADRYAVQAGEELPESVDWRDKGAVNPVKDQGQCG